MVQVCTYSTIRLPSRKYANKLDVIVVVIVKVAESSWSTWPMYYVAYSLVSLAQLDYDRGDSQESRKRDHKM